MKIMDTTQTTTWQITAKGRLALMADRQSVREVEEQRVRREASVRRGPAAFSIWK